MAEAWKHHHTGHRQRLKAEFLARGLEGWPDHKVLGVGEHTAVLLRMLPALLGRYQGSRARLAAVINWPEDAYAWLEPYFFGARNEMVYVLCLDGKRQVLGVRRVAEGSIEMAQVNTRRIAEEALGLRAARIYVAHNHVSNLALPSQADWPVPYLLS